MYSSILRRHSNTSPKLLCSFLFSRSMGGGPRTFPGGINKWQWKRLHEKKAKEKEKRLLAHEKQLYEARIRSQIRAKLAGKPDFGFSPNSDNPTHNPMSPQDHIKALADRFMKEGAEDLWNDDDGPVKSPPPLPPKPYHQSSRPIECPVDLRNFTSHGRSLEPGNGRIVSRVFKPRHYSVQVGRRFRRNESSSSNDDSDVSYGDEFSSGLVNEDVASRGRRNAQKKMSSAALAKYDVKITKRRMMPKSNYEEEGDFSEQIQLIRHELSMKKNLAEKEEEKEEGESILSQKRFDECGASPLTVKALSSAGYVQMTRVQEVTLDVCLEGKDALVKAKTGTGKSAAFLIPAIETVLKATPSNRIQRGPPILVLIICPTRELASQIAAEANVMLKYHDRIGVQTLVGGTRFKFDQKRLESDPCQILVATPGRLLDHIENRGNFSVRLMGLKMLVLDEADHLLDLGYRRDMEKIVDCLPRQRQSLLFSATNPKEVRRISQLILKKEHVFVDTVGFGHVETPARVRQSYLVAPHKLHFHIMYHLLRDHILQVPDYKVIVFCTTAMVTSLLFLLLQDMKVNVREIHSRKSQIYRARISEEFRESKRLVLVTSDVSARGINYPDVTLVIQMGIPSDREQYIHRLGRTGREGKEGEGILLVAPWEEYFLDEIKDLPLEKFPLPLLDPDLKFKVDGSMDQIDSSVKEGAYHAWLGYYNSIREIGRDKTTLVELADQFCESIALHKPPPLFRKTALKMGLKDIPGIKIRK